MTSSQATTDVGAYCARIGYDGPRTPALEILAELQRLHLRTIAFENLDSLLGRPVRLDLASIEAKLVRGSRGGYCFEHAKLFRSVLDALGVPTRTFLGRVVLDAPADAQPARTHMLLVAELGGTRYLVDVGFGGLAPTAPLLFETGRVQTTSHEDYRIEARGDAFQLEARVGDAWKPLYRFDLTPQLDIDIEVANHYVATYPTSFFRTALMAARVASDGRHTLINDRLSFTRPDGTKESRTLADAVAVADALDTVFGLAVPPDLVTRIEAVLRETAKPP